jgi:hypothetical protein
MKILISSLFLVAGLVLVPSCAGPPPPPPQVVKPKPKPKPVVRTDRPEDFRVVSPSN